MERSASRSISSPSKPTSQPLAGAQRSNALRLSGRRKRLRRVLGLALDPTLDLEKLGVIPDVLVILGQNEAPTGRETEVRKN